MASPPRRSGARSWRVEVDGETVCFGTAALTSSVKSEQGVAARPVFELRLQGWQTTYPRAPLPNLSVELLRAVFALLDVRQRGRCALVCKAWRAALAAAPPSGLSAWRRVDLSAAAFAAGTVTTVDSLLTHYILPHHGAFVEELCLRGSGVSASTAQLAWLCCPRLRLFDLRDCHHVCGEAVLSRLLLGVGDPIVNTSYVARKLSLVLLLDGQTPVNRHADRISSPLQATPQLLSIARLLHENRLTLRTDVAACPFWETCKTCSLLCVPAQSPPGVPPPAPERVTVFSCSDCGGVACLVRFSPLN